MSEQLLAQLKSSLDEATIRYLVTKMDITLETDPDNLFLVLSYLKNDKHLDFNVLVDVCGVDYATYGQGEWETTEVTFQGFSRGVDRQSVEVTPKLAVVYHLLSTTHNWRIRVRAFCDNELPIVKTACSLWPAASWFEREAYDLFGILFEGHDDLRRILTDYGFIGHPFRKSFPVSGHVEMRYDAKAERVVYEPVDIEPRVLVPKVIRRDSRYSENTGDA